MKNWFKHTLSLLLCLVMLAALVPAGAALAAESTDTAPVAAEEHTGADDGVIYVNPFYRDVTTPEQLRALAAQATHTAQTRAVKAAAPSYSTISGAASYFRKQMVNRESTISFSIPQSLANKTDNVYHALYDAAVAHSESCTGQEGDALMWVVGGWYGSESWSGSTVTYTYTVNYYTTAAQEKTLTSEVNSAMSSLKLSGKTEKQKIRAIHDYICDRVNYDYDHLNDTSYVLQYTAYAAMHNRTAVCQGYAVLFYRMCKEAGLDVRVVTSYDHAWNIVRIGNLYYNVDTTWDGGDDNTVYDWYLKGMRDFPNHPREYPYNTEAFDAAYPMAPDPALNAANLDVTFTTPGGAKVSSAANGKPKVLIFGNICNSSTTRDALTGFGNYSFNGLDVYCVDVGGNDRDAVKAAAAELGCSSMTCCWDTGNNNAWAMWDYLERCGDNSSSVYLPVIIYIDGSNRIQTFSTDEVNPSTMAKNVREYLGLTLKYRAPRLTVKPADVACYEGDRVELDVAALGQGDLSYQWYIRTGPTAAWQKSGSDSARSALYTTTAALRMNGWQYRCGVTNAYGTTYTDPVTLTVYGAPAIKTQPKNASGAVGDTARFQVTASGGELSYRWQYYTGSKWANSGLTGNTTASLSVPVTDARNGQKYRCVVTDGKGRQVISSAATLTVKIAITAHPRNITAPVGDTALFKVQATGAGLKYQWQYKAAGGTNWVNSTMTGANTASLKVPVTAARNGYQYRCVVTDVNGKKYTSNNGRLTVKTVVTAQPTGVAVGLGETAKFTVKASGVGLTYQWQYKTATGTNWVNSTATGNDSAKLEVKATAARNGQQYRCVITDANGKKTYTDPATLTVE